MTRFLSRMTALALGGFGISSLWAAEVTFSGFFDADVAGYYKGADPESNNVEYQANHELDLTATIAFSKMLSVDLYATSYTQGPTGGTVPAQGSDAENRWTGFGYDGFVASAQLSEDLTVKFGDLSFNAGQFNYYGYKRTMTYASIMADRGFRGMELDAMGFSLAAGADSKYGYGAYAAYTLGVGESSIKPFVSYAGDQQEDSKSLRTGVEASLAFGEQKLNLAAGMLKDNGTEISSTVKVEPILSFGSVSLAATAFLAILDDKKPTPINVPEYLFVYVEPGYSVNSTLSVGLPLEFHTMSTNKDDKLEEFWVVPTLYAALAEGLNWSVWGQSSFRIGDDHTSDDPYLGFGSELILEF